MKFRNEKVDIVAVKSGDAKTVVEFVKAVGMKHTIVDVQYGFALDKDYGEWHSVLILARKK